MTGVVATPPSAPRLVMVMVEPVSSSLPALFSRAALETRATSSAVSHTSRASACFTTGTINPFAVCVAMPICTA